MGCGGATQWLGDPGCFSDQFLVFWQALVQLYSAFWFAPGAQAAKLGLASPLYTVQAVTAPP
jgi:hypothetical protein